ncbi:MAG: hypothetical protein CMP14_01515 [Rickettsiales bacterium]|nr:hypothetical protein [Rickettsiales bacterium]
MKLTVDCLYDLLLEAAETERRLPSVDHRSITYWPEIQAVGEWLAYPDEKTQTRIAKASTGQITNYYFVLDIVLTIPSISDRKLVWGVAHSAAFRSRGPAWLKISKIFKCDRRTIKNRFMQILMVTVIRYNERRRLWRYHL